MIKASRAVGFVLLLLVACVARRYAAANDYFLTIGGGYSPTGNQVSLEKNVLMFRDLLGEQYAPDTPHDIYFADGNDDGRDVVFADPAYEIPKANRLLAEVLRQESHLGDQYRSHEIPGVRGASSRAAIQGWFAQQGKTLQAGDRLIVYVTAHGGKSDDKKQPGNTKLYLWNGEHIKMKELAAHLDKLPDGVSTVLVMVQCYSGGFANVIFQGGDEKQGLSGRDRCGFFATVHTRPAAGCTADINEENYEEFSSYFWTALRGRRRSGEPIERPDYDQDGAVSFAEAHAFAVLQSPTIDIPVKTSDALLRAKSKLEMKGRDDLLSADAAYDELFKLATAAERAVIEGLSKELELTQQERAKEAKVLADKSQKGRRRITGERGKKFGAYNSAAGEIRKVLINRWPELNNRWDPAVGKLLARGADEVVKAIESHRRYAELRKLNDEIENLDQQSLALEKKWCKCQRLIRTLENVALAHNLPLLADDDVQERYQRLAALENGVLGADNSGERRDGERRAREQRAALSGGH